MCVSGYGISISHILLHFLFYFILVLLYVNSVRRIYQKKKKTRFVDQFHPMADVLFSKTLKNYILIL